MTPVSIPSCRPGLLALLAASLLGTPLLARAEVLYKLSTHLIAITRFTTDPSNPAPIATLA
jgi:hypothetical protein|uniref:hypothetical protein n=1 Tax=Cyanobium sp. TaxID=2164130 RepID=UPI00404AE31C